MGKATITWEKDAEAAVAKIPFFIRPKVRRAVEEAAARAGDSAVTMSHVRACRKHYLTKMAEEVKGWQVETCFGPGGCPNRAVVERGFAERVEALVAGRNLREFLAARVEGHLKFHHEFRVSISDCPNACSRPQIADIGLLGAVRPEVTTAPCNLCNACVDICKEKAVRLHGRIPVIDEDGCVTCGQCVKVCPTRTLVAGAKGYRIQVGGRLGRHPRLGHELPGIYNPAEALDIVSLCLDHYTAHSQGGERFAAVLERTGTGFLPPPAPQESAPYKGPILRGLFRRHIKRR